MRNNHILITKSMLKDFARKNHIQGELLALQASRPWLPSILFNLKFDSLTKELIELDEKYAKKEKKVEIDQILVRVE